MLKTMNMAILSEIEKKIYQLSLEEQLWLIEKVIQRMRNGDNIKDSDDMEYELADMANDSEIRKEIDIMASFM